MIPVLLVEDEGLVKTIKFKDSRYLGDPINAVRLYNDMEVDELIVLDISATIEKKGPNFEMLHDIVDECFMPLSYGGGVRNIKDIEQLFRLGIEKIIINNSVVSHNVSFIKEAVNMFGSQSIVVAIDINKNLFSKHVVYDYKTKKNLKINIEKYIQNVINLNIGELFVNFIYNDGMMNGYDLKVIRILFEDVTIPLIVCGGAGSLLDMKDALNNGADAAAAGSLFVYKGKQKGIMINYPTQEELNKLFLKYDYET
jgi:imidazole glycerol-phosphate synthase subunit HisF